MVKIDKRFYEPLVLLGVMSPNRGERIEQEMYHCEDSELRSSVQTRRDLLNQLCVVCDHQRGGDTVTAMALEQKPAGPVFWISAPAKALRKIEPFMVTTLNWLASSVAATSAPDEDKFKQVRELARHFVGFCHLRLTNTRDMLHHVVSNEVASLQQKGSFDPTSRDSDAFLARCKLMMQRDVHLESLCMWAFRARRIPFVRKSKTDPALESLSDDIRHYLGRLGSVHRAAKILLRLSNSHENLFVEWKLELVATGDPCPGPRAPLSLDLGGIANRMIGGNRKECERLTQALDSLDRTANLLQNIKREFEPTSFKLKVHAETALAEALFQADIQFYDRDRYIACSKPACFCCYHYFQCHPGGFVPPPSHNNLWIKWRMPDVPVDDSGGVDRQKKIMNSMVARFRAVVIDEVLNRSGVRRRWAPDSTTGFTSTVRASHGPEDNAHGRREVEDVDLAERTGEMRLDGPSDDEGGVPL